MKGVWTGRALSAYLLLIFQCEHAVATICAMGNLHATVVHFETAPGAGCSALACFTVPASVLKICIMNQMDFPWAESSSQKLVEKKARSALSLEQFTSGRRGTFQLS